MKLITLIMEIIMLCLVIYWYTVTETLCCFQWDQI